MHLTEDDRRIALELVAAWTAPPAAPEDIRSEWRWKGCCGVYDDNDPDETWTSLSGVGGRGAGIEVVRSKRGQEDEAEGLLTWREVFDFMAGQQSLF